MKTRFKVLFAVMAIIGVFLTVQINNAFALELKDCWPDGNTYFGSTYDVRTYHESHPLSGMVNSPGGWVQTLTVTDPAAAAQIASITMNFDSTYEGAEFSFTQTIPFEYKWFTETNYDYGMWIGHRTLIDTNGVEFTGVDTNGDPITFANCEGPMGTVLTLQAPLDMPAPPIAKIKRMAIKRNGDLKMKFTAPYDTRNTEIRIRIFDEAGDALFEMRGGLEVDGRYPSLLSPYQFTKKDGTVVPDKVRVVIPEAYTGMKGRIEYRVNDGSGLRGITYFKLPELELE